MEIYKEACRHFSVASGLDTMVRGVGGGEPVGEGDVYCGGCVFSSTGSLRPEEREQCRIAYEYASSQAMRFGGKYVSFCHRGFAHLASPVFGGGKLEGTVFAGPFLLVSRDEYLNEDSKWGGDKEELRRLLESVTVLSPGVAFSFSELLYYLAGHLSCPDSSSLSGGSADVNMPEIVSQYIERIQDNSGFYPLEKEDALLLAMASGDVNGCKAILDNLVSYIFSDSELRFEAMRSRVLELTVLLSRVAGKGGANSENIFGVNYNNLRDISSYDNANDLSEWLNKIMDLFMDHIFRFSEAKHADVIYKAINFIKANYMNKISLEDVAGAVYLSPAYFSRVFKQETGHNFSSYLNKVRIDESKLLLKNAKVNISDISGMVGYEDQSYYSKVFKKVTGMSPLKYRQSRNGE